MAIRGAELGGIREKAFPLKRNQNGGGEVAKTKT